MLGSNSTREDADRPLKSKSRVLGEREDERERATTVRGRMIGGVGHSYRLSVFLNLLRGSIGMVLGLRLFCRI